MKRIITVLLLAAISFAGEWELGINANLTATLNQYSKSWTGSETGNFAWNTKWIGTAHYQAVEKFRVENTLNLAFGQSANQKYDSTKDEFNGFDTLSVSNDEIDFQNLEVFTLGGVIEPYIGLRATGTFYNQLTENTKVKYGNPWTFTQAAGIRLALLKKEEKQDLKTRLGFGSREFVNRKVDYTVDGGFEWVTNYELSAKEGLLSYKTQLELFQAVTVSDEKLRGDKWKAIDVRWQNDFSVNITKFIMINYTYELKYDRDISERVRYRQMLSAGFSLIANSSKKEDK